VFSLSLTSRDLLISSFMSLMTQRKKKKKRDPKKLTGRSGGQTNREQDKQTNKTKFQVQEQ
jgi:hypothetical protein